MMRILSNIPLFVIVIGASFLPDTSFLSLQQCLVKTRPWISENCYESQKITELYDSEGFNQEHHLSKLEITQVSGF